MISGLSASQKKAMDYWVPRFEAELHRQGFPAWLVPYCLAQKCLETAYFTSNVWVNNLNAGGVKYVGSPGTTRGTKAPTSTDGPNAGYYAKFNTLADFVTEYKRVLSLQRGKNNLGAPIAARTVADFARRLYLNGYHQIAEGRYLSMIKTAVSRVLPIVKGAGGAVMDAGGNFTEYLKKNFLLW